MNGRGLLTILLVGLFLSSNTWSLLQSINRSQITNDIIVDEEEQLTFSPFDHGTPQWSPDGLKLCYHRNNSIGFQEIYILDIISGEEIPLTNTSFYHRVISSSAWSPDGKWIVCEEKKDGGYQLCLINVDERKETILTNEPVDHFSSTFSPDGEWIVYIRIGKYNHYQIYKISTKGGEEIPLTFDNNHHYSPTWSPDGKWIIYQKQTLLGWQLYRIPVTGGKETPITYIPGVHGEPDISVDGEWLVYKYKMGQGNILKSQIYKKHVNSFYEIPLTHTPFTHGNPQISPNRGWIVYTRSDVFQQLYIISSNGGTERRLTTSPVHHYSPRWSPDGRKISYIREDENGILQIFIYRFQVDVKERREQILDEFIQDIEKNHLYNDVTKDLNLGNVWSYREVLYYAMALSYRNIYTYRVDEIVANVILHQETNKSSPAYGSYIHPNTVNWPNPEFDIFDFPPLLWIIKKHPELLKNKTKRDLANSLSIACDAVLQNWYPWIGKEDIIGHTNLALQYILLLIVGGEICEREDAIAAGNDAFDRWINFSLKYPWHEFNSPNYYAVDHYSLCNLAELTENPNVQRKALAWLDFLWTDIALHWYGYGGLLCGARSRDYEVITSPSGYRRGITRDLWLYGFTNIEPKSDPVIGRAATVEYIPPSYVYTLAYTKVNELHHRWGPDNGEDEYLFIGESFVMGSSSYYGNSDKPLTIDILSTEKDLISILPTVANNDIPYELTAGKLHGIHIHTRSNTLQYRDAAIILFDLDLGEQKAIGDCITSNVLFPINVDGIYLNNEDITKTLQSRCEITISQDDILYIVENQTYVAVQILPSDGIDGFTPIYKIMNEGYFYNSHTVGRLAVYLYKGDKQKFIENNIKTGFIFRIGNSREYNDFEAFCKQIEEERTTLKNIYHNGIWNVTYTAGTNTLCIEKDILNFPNVTRKINWNPYYYDVESSSPYIGDNIKLEKHYLHIYINDNEYIVDLYPSDS